MVLICNFFLSRTIDEDRIEQVHPDHLAAEAVHIRLFSLIPGQ